MAAQIYSFKTDIWSVGIINYTILSLKQAYNGRTDEEILKKVLTTDFMADNDNFRMMSLDGKHFMKKLCARSVYGRFSAS